MISAARSDPRIAVDVRRSFHVGVGGEVGLETGAGKSGERRSCRREIIDGIRSGREKKAVKAER